MSKDGDVFVIQTGEEAAIEFMVVRENIDDNTVVLMVPLDDCFLVGTPDFLFPYELVGRPLVARCGQAFWFPKESLMEKERHCHKVGSIPVEGQLYVRNKIANLARGFFPDQDNKFAQDALETDADPEYEDWMQIVSRARTFVEEHS